MFIIGTEINKIDKQIPKLGQLCIFFKCCLKYWNKNYIETLYVQVFMQSSLRPSTVWIVLKKNPIKQKNIKLEVCYFKSNIYRKAK